MLAPLEPDLFLRWVWLSGPRDKGTAPLTLDDLHYELGHEMTREQIRRQYVHLAARVRFNQRIGADPMEGIW